LKKDEEKVGIVIKTTLDEDEIDEDSESENVNI